MRGYDSGMPVSPLMFLLWVWGMTFGPVAIGLLWLISIPFRRTRLREMFLCIAYCCFPAAWTVAMMEYIRRQPW
jgi:hypothetical protein